MCDWRDNDCMFCVAGGLQSRAHAAVMGYSGKRHFVALEAIGGTLFTPMPKEQAIVERLVT